jgi:hypothetical protein
VRTRPESLAGYRLQAAIALHAFDCGHRRADIAALEHAAVQLPMSQPPAPPMYSRVARPSCKPFTRAPSWFDRLMRHLRPKEHA